MAPQSVWPQIIILVTFNTDTAYSMAEVVPPVSLLCGGTTLPTLRKINKSPGSEPVTIFGSIRESEQVINKVSGDRKSTRLNSSHVRISYAVFCLKKKKKKKKQAIITYKKNNNDNNN